MLYFYYALLSKGLIVVQIHFVKHGDICALSYFAKNGILTKELANRIKMNRQYSQRVHCMCPHIPTQHTPAQRMFSLRSDCNEIFTRRWLPEN